MDEQRCSRHRISSPLNQGIKHVAGFVPARPYMDLFTISGHAKSCIIYKRDSQECSFAAKEQLEDTLK